MNTKFDQIIRLEDAVAIMETVIAFRPNGLSIHAKGQQDVGLAADRQRLYAAVDALTPDEMLAYGQYRAEVKAARQAEAAR